MPLAGGVNAIKIVLLQAREEGGLHFVLATICVLEIALMAIGQTSPYCILMIINMIVQHS